MNEKIKKACDTCMEVFLSLNHDEQVEVFKTIQQTLVDIRNEHSATHLKQAEEHRVVSEIIVKGNQVIFPDQPSLKMPSSY